MLKVQKYHLKLTALDPVSLVAGSVLRARWAALVRGAAPAGWRHTLAALLTHCSAPELPLYCGKYTLLC